MEFEPIEIHNPFGGDITSDSDRKSFQGLQSDVVLSTQSLTAQSNLVHSGFLCMAQSCAPMYVDGPDQDSYRQVRRELPRAMMRGLESALINGDNCADVPATAETTIDRLNSKLGRA